MEKKVQEEYSTFLNAPFLLLMVYNIFFCMSYGMITPILMEYLVDKGLALEIAGMIAGVVSMTSLIVRPLSGYFTDRLNKKKLLFFASVMLGMAMLGLATVNNVGLMMLCRVLQGIGFAVNGTCCIAMATEYMPSDKLGEGIGYFGIANIISTAVAPMIGIELADRIGYKYTILVAGASVMTAAVFILFFKYYTYHSHESTGKVFCDACKTTKISDLISFDLIPLTIFVGVFSFANSVASNYLALICQEKEITAYSIYFTVNAVVMVLTRPVLGKVCDRRGISTVLYPAFLITSIAMLMIGAGNSIWLIYAAAILKALGQGSGQPALQTECLKQLGPKKRGLATSAFYVGSDVANGLGPVIGGIVVGGMGYSAIFYVSAIFLLTAFIGYFFYCKARKVMYNKMEVDDNGK